MLDGRQLIGQMLAFDKVSIALRRIISVGDLTCDST